MGVVSGLNGKESAPNNVVDVDIEQDNESAKKKPAG